MHRHVVRWVVGLVLSALCVAPPAFADLTLAKDTPDLPLTEGLRVADISQWGRRAINVDGVVQMMVDGTLGEPKAGDVVKRPEAMGGGERKWEEVKANEKGEFGGDGWVRGGAGSYVLCVVEAEEPRVMVLTGIGHSMVYVNGEPRVGDPYMHGYVRIPVAIRKGRNQLLFAHAGRGVFKAKLETPSKSGGVEINTGDLTLPDVLTDTPGEYMLGVPLVNCSETSQRVVIFATGPGGLEPARGSEVVIVPLGIYKAPVSVALKAEAGEGGAGGATEMKVRLRIFDADVVPPARNTPGADIRPLSEETITLRVRQPHEIHKRTFISAIDGSVQYVGIVPPRAQRAEEKESGGAEEKANASGSESRPTQTRPGLVLSLHGASVEAIRQAESYASKDDLVIVCPTNRRPFGFDWEDWGRVDAIEAMDHAKKWYDTDPSRQYLTGHSMGGHGTWQLGVLYPDRFAAIAPSAGWLSFDTYAAARGDADKKPEHPAAEFFRRASASSDTVALMENLRGKGIYILHGDADDNVPVTEARKARAELDKLGIAYEFHEQPDAGHWWGGKNDPGFGAACVDWKPIFEMFERTRLVADGAVRSGKRLDLMRGVPGSPEETGIQIVRREREGLPSDVRITVSEEEKRLSIQTTNVKAFLVSNLLRGRAFGWTFEMNGQAIEPPGAPSQMFVHNTRGNEWECVAPDVFKRLNKGELSTGPFKSLFNDGFVLVYGNGGSPEQNGWALAKARYDADQWWYRGNGRAQVLSSSAWQNSGEWGKVPQRPVVLYGNSNTNSVIDGGMRDTAIYVSDELVYAAGKRLDGDRSILCVQSFSGRGLLGLIGGTSLRAMRATDRLPYFLSGVGFPDVTVLDADIWSRGMAGVAGVGFFGYDWSVDKGEFWWREQPAK